MHCEMITDIYQDMKEVRLKYKQTIAALKCIAENPCLCKAGCPRCDAIETLRDLGEIR